jgi:hypothetical protein
MTTSEEWGIKLGHIHWKLLKILEMSSGCYIIPCLGDTGLHLSFHPSTEEYSMPHVHFKADKLEIHEDVTLDESCYSKEYWLEKVEQFISLFELGCNAKLDNTRVLVLPDFSQLIDGNDRQRYFNLDSIIDGRIYSTKERTVPALAKKLQREVLLGINENNQLLLFEDKENLIKLDPNQFSKTLMDNDSAFFNPIKNTLETVMQQLQSRIPVYPPNIIPSPFFQQLQNIQRRKLKFQIIEY